MVKSVYRVKNYSHEIEVIYYDHIGEEGVTFTVKGDLQVTQPWVGETARMYPDYKSAYHCLMKRLQGEWWEYANAESVELRSLADHLKDKIRILKTQAPWP